MMDQRYQSLPFPFQNPFSALPSPFPMAAHLDTSPSPYTQPVSLPSRPSLPPPPPSVQTSQHALALPTPAPSLDYFASHGTPDDPLIPKRRRRTSPAELMVLEEEFARNTLPSQGDRQLLASRLGMSGRALQVSPTFFLLCLWFLSLSGALGDRVSSMLELPVADVGAAAMDVEADLAFRFFSPGLVPKQTVRLASLHPCLPTGVPSRSRRFNATGSVA